MASLGLWSEPPESFLKLVILYKSVNILLSLIVFFLERESKKNEQHEGSSYCPERRSNIF
jgi:hypothetical protein